MFRTGLLVSTAMTAVALLLSGASAGTFAQTDMHVASHDPNTRFLCTYGHFRLSAHAISSSGWHSFGWNRVAVPVKGHGQTVNQIRVVEARGRSSQYFSAGIYKSTAKGYPGRPIAAGVASVTQSCGQVNISIAPTKLKRHTTYWIVESIEGITARNAFPSAPSSQGWEDSIYWAANPNTNRRAYAQEYRRTWRYSSSGVSYTSPWTQQTMGPYLKLYYVTGKPKHRRPVQQ